MQRLPVHTEHSPGTLNQQQTSGSSTLAAFVKGKKHEMKYSEMSKYCRDALFLPRFVLSFFQVGMNILHLNIARDIKADY